MTLLVLILLLEIFRGKRDFVCFTKNLLSDYGLGEKNPNKQQKTNKQSNHQNLISKFEIACHSVIVTHQTVKWEGMEEHCSSPLMSLLCNTKHF